MFSRLRNPMMLVKYLILLACVVVSLKGFNQTVVSGFVLDPITGDKLPGATVVIKGTTVGAVSDLDGKFEISVNEDFPITIEVSFMGYETQTVILEKSETKLKIKLNPSALELEAFEVRALSISKKQKESALTVETMDVIEIKETPALNFYEGLGALKGVDLTSASIGFKIINTRGFNSTSPVRSLQLIDGIDNQAPGLNFSLGNFLGASELDIQRVDLIVGASSPFYGPNAFNGVISMQTKDPFLFQGLSVSAKYGERDLKETSLRYARGFKNKNGEDKVAFKVNFFYLEAYDWVADNDSAVYNSEHDMDNPGGYDAVNTYGDEVPTYYNSKNNQVQMPGIGVIYRTGYKEEHIVDYNTTNLKAGGALHYKFNENNRLILGSNFGTGTTIYQGDNRYSLKDILFFQNHVEFRGRNGFLRAYATKEDAGNSYDAVFTALLMQEEAKDISRWSTDYGYYWATLISPKVKALDSFPRPEIVDGSVFYDFEKADDVIAANMDSLITWHNMIRDSADLGKSPPGGFAYTGNFNLPQPGTPEFDSVLAEVTSKTSFEEGGSRLFDQSALYHIHGEHSFNLDSSGINTKVITGGNFRLYTPISKGTIFSDTAGIITNDEYGAYLGLEKKFFSDNLKANFTFRSDKNRNFPFVYTPAASLVYNIDENNTIRTSFSSATRNPTLADQYLFYNTGRAILLGNLNGFDSLVTVESAVNLMATQNVDTLDYFNVAPIVPEKVKTFEVGFRSLLANSFYVDANYYYSFYRDFIGYNIGVYAEIDSITNLFNPGKTKVYRIAANATDVVTTQGMAVALSYYFKKYIKLTGNYSWNKLDLHGSEDPIIPAFNTPEHKYNLGIRGRDISISIPLSKKENPRRLNFKHLGFSINYKWIQGFLYQGSPQFTGFVPTYDLLDAQVSKRITSIGTTVKLGGSNLLNNKMYQVYGGPRVGRMMYFSILVELDKI